MPRDVRAFLHEAERRVELFQRSSRIPGFVASDFVGAYGVLRTLADEGVAPGRLFCEWGSGFGVVACLAAMLDFDAWGVEVEGELVDAARRLADAFGLSVQFSCGTFIPEGGEANLRDDDFSWLSTGDPRRHQESDLTADDFDVIYAYPWPDEEELTGDLFRRYAAVGALLVTHHGGDDFRVRRKKRGRSRRK